METSKVAIGPIKSHYAMKTHAAGTVKPDINPSVDTNTTLQKGVQFSYDKTTHSTVVQVVQDGDVIETIPPSEILSFLKAWEQNVDKLLDTEI